jgi:hypothetical protein
MAANLANHPLACEQACFILPAEKLAKERQFEMAYYRDLRLELPDGMLR